MVSKDEMIAFFRSEFPKAGYVIEGFTDNSVIVRHQVREQDLRPGGTVSGPTMMALADAAMYVAILGNIGKVALAVTTNLNINFYRKPAPGKLRAEARILKMGARLAVGDVLLYSEGVDQSVAHVTITYSIPTQ